MFEDTLQKTKLSQGSVQLEKIAKNLPGIIYQFKIDQHGKMTFPFVSNKVENFLGFTVDEIYEDGNLLIDQIHPDDRSKFEETTQQSMKNMETYHLQHRHFTKDKKIVWLDVKSTPAKMEDGSTLWTGICIEITKQKETEERLQTQEIQTKAIFEASPVSMMIIDEDTNVVAANNILKKVFNVTDSDLINTKPGDGLQCIVSYNSKEGCGNSEACNSCEMRKTSLQVLSTGKAIKNKEVNNTFIINGKETNVWIEMSVEPLKYNDSTHLIIAFNDITRRKNTEILLRESERKFRFLFENAPLSYQSLDNNGCFLNVNQKFLETLGYKYNEIVNNSFEKVLADNDSIEKFHTNFPRFKERGHIEDVHFNLKKKNGEVIVVSIDGRCTYDENGTFKQTHCIFDDISKKVEFENKLIESEKKYKEIAELTQDWTYWIDENQKYLFMSPSVEEYTGYTFEDFESNRITLQDLATNEFKELVTKHMTSNFAEIGDSCSLDFKIKAKDGTIKWINHVCKSVYDDEGNFLGRRGSNRDITQMKLDQETQLEDEKRFRLALEEEVVQRTKELDDRNNFLGSLLNTIPHPIFVKDRQGNFTSVNEAFLNFYERTLDEIIGNNVAILASEDIVTKTNEIDNNLLNKPGNIIYETYHILKSGEKRIIQIYKTTFGTDENNPTGVAGIVLDVTDQKKFEYQTQKALDHEQELNEMKTNFISMVSHEFRTPLTSILASADLLELYGKNWTEEKYNKNVKILQESVQDMVELLDDVLVLSRTDRGKIKFEPEKTNISKIVYQLIDRINSETNNLHLLEIEIDEKLPVLNVDEKLITGILNHLIGNAIKFSVTGTSISIKISYKENTLSFQITDKGIGIEDEELDNIFTPFYRSPEVSDTSGSGLGLAIVKKFVELHNGNINVESKVGKGTSFKVNLPAIN